MEAITIVDAMNGTDSVNIDFHRTCTQIYTNRLFKMDIVNASTGVNTLTQVFMHSNSPESDEKAADRRDTRY